MTKADRASPPRVVLASSSRWRAELLTRLGLPFEGLAPDFDELGEAHRFPELGEEGFALHLARHKAAVVAARRPDAWILAADQIAVIPSERPGGSPVLLHKPGTHERAVQQLMRLRGRVHHLVTGVVLRGPDGGSFEAIDRQEMRMRTFSEAEARTYVEAHAPIDSVGAYHIEDSGIALFEYARGDDFTGIIGLPLMSVGRLFRRAGLLPGSPAALP